MSIAEEVAAGVAGAMGPISDHLVVSVSKELGKASQDVLQALSGKKIHIETDITFPNLTS